MFSTLSSYLSSMVTWYPTVGYSREALTHVIPSHFPSTANCEIHGEIQQAKHYFPELFDKIEGLRDDILIYQGAVGHATSYGTNWSSKAIILINIDLIATDTDVLNFLCKHEISHIKDSDKVITSSLSAIVSTVSTFAIPLLQACLPGWLSPVAYCLPLAVGKTVDIIATRLFEEKAERFALKHATMHELLGMERFLLLLIKENKSISKIQPIIFNADGNIKFAFHQIPLTKRLENVEKERVQRNTIVPVSTHDSIEKLSRIRAFHRKVYTVMMGIKVE